MKLWLYYIIIFFGIILARYFVVAGRTYWLYSSNYKIVKQPDLELPSRQSIQKDIALSIITTLALAICVALVMTTYDFGATRLYLTIGDKPDGMASLVRPVSV